MKRRRLLPLLLGSSLLATLSVTAFAHHGWSEYDAGKPLDLAGTIAASGYTQPHGFIELKTAGKTWHVVLAPPSRMEGRGLPKAALVAGAQATVHGYPHRTKPDELRAERITIGDKTTELR
ncbi:hypothetical protein IP91_02171 [Pseudoduganella lurida]|uniref:Uncharacterized protein n=1 Tax=Pseudoduganella lurida TaxID=1036180 RepID=A0A562RBE0_9BURK|nr:DUF6152 family protein [Pseudoduganella lurida]TWI66358.1 hypothetical protein IP91_02171 [Pseudoduganella lurida]